MDYSVWENWCRTNIIPVMEFEQIEEAHFALRGIDSSCIYRYLAFPRLRRLHLPGTAILHPNQPVADLVARSSQGFTSLTLALQSSGENNERIQEILRVCGNLEHLVPYGSSSKRYTNTEVVFQWLTWDDDRPAEEQCPRLQSFELEFSVIPVSTVLMMVKSRLDSTSSGPTHSLSIFRACVLDIRSLESLRIVPGLTSIYQSFAIVERGADELTSTSV